MAEAEVDIEKLKNQRASARASLTRIKNIVETKKDALSLPELECRLGILESYFKQVLSYHTSYETLKPVDNTNITYRAECEEIYVAAKALLVSLIANQKQNLSSNAPELNQSFIVKPSPATNLHKIKLPRFNGKYSEYPNFIGIFNKSIHTNTNYETIEKCNILVSSLDGIAKNAVREFRISEENYLKILKHLDARFNNKTLMFQELIGELFQLPKITRATATNLRNMVDSVNAILSSMLSIGTGENIANSMIIYVVMSKLDIESQNKWEEAVDFSDLLSWQDCSKVLSKRCQFLECKEVKQSSSLSISKFQNKSFSRNSNSSVLSVSQSFNQNSSSCPICNDSNHSIYKCKKFTELPVMNRFERVKGLSLCINCLNRGHSVKKCNSSKCRICSASHHTLLHRFNSSNNTSSTTDRHIQQTSNSSLVTTVDSSSALFSSFNNSLIHPIDTCNVILATAVINIRNKNGLLQPVRALLDSGSQLNFITDRLVNNLALKKKRISTGISGIANTNVKVKFSIQSTIKSRLNDFTTSLNMFVLPSIAGIMPDSPIPVKDWNIPKNIELADPQFFVQQNVDILIGAEIFFDIMSVGQIKLGPNMPLLQKTLLGWIVSGKYNSNIKQVKCNSLVTFLENDESDINSNLHELVKDFWKIETLDTTPSKLTEEEMLCERFF